MLAFAGAAMMLASCGETSMKVETLDTAVNEALMAGREDSLHVVISLEYPVANISDEARKWKLPVNGLPITSVYITMNVKKP